jgi:phosphoribosylformylglycinamidine synthase
MSTASIASSSRAAFPTATICGRARSRVVRPIVEALPGFVARGGLVLGSCNGFQILCEAGLLPGTLLRNECLQFRCQWTHVAVEQTESPFTRGLRRGQVLKMPIAHGEGRYHAEPALLRQLRERDQIVFRYATEAGEITPGANPNGSVWNVAGVCNEEGTVVGLMPHPERAAETDDRQHRRVAHLPLAAG